MNHVYDDLGRETMTYRNDDDDIESLIMTYDIWGRKTEEDGAIWMFSLKSGHFIPLNR